MRQYSMAVQKRPKARHVGGPRDRVARPAKKFANWTARLRVPAQRDPKKVHRDPRDFWLILGPAEVPDLTGT
jgi:hypothetical protein